MWILDLISPQLFSSVFRVNQFHFVECHQGASPTRQRNPYHVPKAPSSSSSNTPSAHQPFAPSRETSLPTCPSLPIPTNPIPPIDPTRPIVSHLRNHPCPSVKSAAPNSPCMSQVPPFQPTFPHKPFAPSREPPLPTSPTQIPAHPARESIRAHPWFTSTLPTRQLLLFTIYYFQSPASPSRQNLRHHPPMHIRQPEIPALEPVRQALVRDSQQVQDRRLQIMHMHLPRRHRKP